MAPGGNRRDSSFFCVIVKDLLPKLVATGPVYVLAGPRRYSSFLRAIGLQSSTYGHQCVGGRDRAPARLTAALERVQQRTTRAERVQTRSRLSSSALRREGARSENRRLTVFFATVLFRLSAVCACERRGDASE